MKYWIIRLEWRQTNHEFVVASSEAAVAKFKYANGPRFVTCYGSTDKIVS